ncbi:hypothetical protein GCM10023185_28420 [Hymenobacter saemangeumensis]|uniref:Uncharacterized protein n=1 Tax=Hymenobacter saemangeumensis TaxID=1084522 RepID=A0ABP8ILC6_9BACT
MEQPFKKPSFWPESGPPFTRYNELDTFLRMSSFAWHAELACRKWLERGATFPGGLNTPKTTAWMSLLSYVNPPLDAGQEFGISPEKEPEVSILRAYQLLLTGLSVTEVVERMEEHPLPDNLPDFLING